jgi:hypothetical protein
MNLIGLESVVEIVVDIILIGVISVVVDDILGG